MRTSVMRVVALVAGAALLAGCSDGGKQPADDTAAEQSSSESRDEESAKAAGIDSTDPPEPVATGTVPATISEDPDAQIDVEFFGLERQGKTVVATYSFTLQAEGTDDKAYWLYDMLGDQGWHPTLVDTENLTLHPVLRSDNGPAAFAYQGAKYHAGQTFYAYAFFAAPPEGVSTMSANVIDGMPTVTQVPVR